MNTTMMTRDDLEIGMHNCETLDAVRAQVAYYDAIDDADQAGEPWFSFEEFLARVARQARHNFCTAVTLPAPSPESDDDCIPF